MLVQVSAGVSVGRPEVGVSVRGVAVANPGMVGVGVCVAQGGTKST